MSSFDEWREFSNKFRRANPDLSFAAAQKAASQEWHRLRGTTPKPRTKPKEPFKWRGRAWQENPMFELDEEERREEQRQRQGQRQGQKLLQGQRQKGGFDLGLEPFLMGSMQSTRTGKPRGRNLGMKRSDVEALRCECQCQGRVSPGFLEGLGPLGLLSPPLNQDSEDTLNMQPYLSFDGECLEAFKFYEKVLGGRIKTKMTYGELENEEPSTADTNAADTVSEDSKNKIAHATIQIGQSTLSGRDIPTDDYVKPKGFYVSLVLDDPPRADKIFKALSKDGSIEKDLERTSWADRHGKVTDRFGIPWMITSMVAPSHSSAL